MLEAREVADLGAQSDRGQRVNAAQAADDPGLKALIEMTKFRFTPEAVYMYKFGTPTIGDLFTISTGTFLPI